MLYLHVLAHGMKYIDYKGTVSAISDSCSTSGGSIWIRAQPIRGDVKFSGETKVYRCLRGCEKKSVRMRMVRGGWIEEVNAKSFGAGGLRAMAAELSKVTWLSAWK